MESSTKAIGQNHTVSDDDWEIMKQMISSHLDNVPKDVTVETLRREGSLECIAQQIKRGDQNPSARLQSWYHAMLEVECTARPFGLQKIKYLFNTHSKDQQSFVLDTTMTTQTSGNEEWKRRSGRPLEKPEDIVARLEVKSNLSVVERQQLWQAKKESSLKNIRQREQSEAALGRKMSAPDLTKSRKSFLDVQQSGQKRSGIDENITNHTVQNKRAKTERKVDSAPKMIASRRQTIR